MLVTPLKLKSKVGENAASLLITNISAGGGLLHQAQNANNMISAVKRNKYKSPTRIITTPRKKIEKVICFE